MPILDLNPTDLKDNTVKKVDNISKQPKNTETERVFRSQEELKTSLLFSGDRDLYSITQQVKGMKWTVDYFMQLRDVNDPAQDPDINLTPTMQKYHRINNLILFLQSAINQDTPDNIEGEAYINAGIMPNKGDAFRATLTGGREAVFVLTEVTNNTYNLHRCFLVRFKLFFFVEANPKLYHDLQFKTVAKYVYNKDYLKDYSAPIILEQDYSNIVDLHSVRSTLIDYYLKTFISNEDTSSVIHLPLQNHALAVDTYLEQFIFSTMGVEDNIKLRDITRIHIPEEDDIQYTLWDLILDKRIDNFNRVQSDINWAQIDYYNKTYVSSRNLLYMGVKYTIQKRGRENLNIIDVAHERGIDYEEPITKSLNKRYVFSEYFYKQDMTQCGILERAVLSLLRNEMIDTGELGKMVKQCYNWDIEDQYYGIPILLVVIKDYINNTYRSI